MSEFTTPIMLDGPAGNIFRVVATASSFLKQLDRAPDAVQLREAVMEAKSYNAALRLVAYWFPPFKDGEPYDPEDAS